MDVRVSTYRVPVSIAALAGMWVSLGIFLDRAWPHVALATQTMLMAIRSKTFHRLLGTTTLYFDFILLILTILCTVAIVFFCLSLLRTILQTIRLRRTLRVQAMSSSGAVEEIRRTYEIRTPIIIARQQGYEAFTVGLFHPVIVLSETLVRDFPPSELTAIILHEYGHVRRYDTIRKIVVTALLPFSFLSARLRSALEPLMTDIELLSDVAVIQTLGTKESLLSALVRLLTASQPRAAVAIASFSVTNHRIERLLGQDTEATLSSMRSFFLGLTSVIAIILLGSSSVMLTQCSKPIRCFLRTANAQTIEQTDAPMSVATVGNVALCQGTPFSTPQSITPIFFH